VKLSFVTVLFITLSLAGCGNDRLEKAEIKYHSEIGRIKLGMTIGEIDPIIKIVNGDLLLSDKVPDESYTKENSVFVVKYMACKYYNDNVITYDEFLPLLFKDEKLIGFGWIALGGPYTTQRHFDVSNTGFGIGIGLTHEIK
jgi:hypothetical protein